MPSSLFQSLLPGRIAVLLLVALLGGLPAAMAQDGRELWAEIAVQAALTTDEHVLDPTAGRSFRVDTDALSAHLAVAPTEQRPGDVTGGVPLALPLPDGTFATYRVVESSVMAPGLQARFPHLRTYVGQDVDDPRATLRLSVTPHGVHAVARRPEGMVYIDPPAPGARQQAVSYWRHDARRADRHAPVFQPDVVVEVPGTEPGSLLGADDEGRRRALASGSTLRVYRTAIAATAEYTAFHSADPDRPSVEEGLAAIVVALARVNEIYEREVAVRFILVEQNDRIVYTDREADPYTNTDGRAMLRQNQANLDETIGSQNYDIGHVFSTGGGGLAGLGVACRTSSKGWGVTGLSSPIGDRFYVEYVAHEIGHQLAANHSFNGTERGCRGVERNASTAFEPGSGSTIMSYAGICHSHNLQGDADAYFHNISLTEIVRYVNDGHGSTCGETISTGNRIPVLEPLADRAVPRGTPFVLRGRVSGPDSAERLSFSWEEMTLGPAGAPPPAAPWADTAPFFRSFLPATTPDRFFPRLESYVTGQATIGEGLPNSHQDLQFRLTVRDSAPGAGVIADRQMAVTVSGEAGPFVVTAPEEVETLWLAGEERTVSWSVAGTDSDSLGGRTVDILLAPDRWPSFADGTAVLLAERVPNTGAALIRVPQGVDTDRARVFVRASDGIFFAVNSVDFRVQSTGTSDERGPQAQVATLSAPYPNPVSGAGGRATVVLSLPGREGQAVRVTVLDALGRERTVLHDGNLPGGAHPFTIDTRALASGVYYVRAVGERFSAVRPLTVVR